MTQGTFRASDHAEGGELERLDLYRVELPLRHAHRAAHGTESRRRSILVRATLRDGTEGWGECPALARPTYTAEYHDGAWALLRDVLAPLRLGPAPADRPWAHGAGAVRGNPMACGALTDAELGAAHERRGTLQVASAYAAMQPVPTMRVLSLTDTVEELLAAVDEATGPVKLKITPETAHEHLGAVRRAFPDRVVAADANGSFAFGEGDILDTIDRYGLLYLEQPYPWLAHTARLAARIETPICLDESIETIEQAEDAHRRGALGVLNVKPARVGGVLTAIPLALWARDNGVDAFVGGMVETGVGRSGAARLATLPAFTLPTDLGPSAQYWDVDVTEPIVTDDRGWLVPPAGTGVNLAPDPDRLAALTIEHVTFTA